MPLDAADLEAIGALIAKNNEKIAADTVKVVDGKLTAFGKSIDVDGKLKAVEEKIAAAKPKEPEEGTEGTPTKGKADTKIEETPAFQKLKAEVAASNKLAEDNRRKAEESEAKRVAEAADAATKSALLAAGADPKRVHIAMSHIKTSGATRLVDGAPNFVTKSQWGEELAPVADGARAYLDSDDGKMFLPPTGSSGTGDKAGSANKAGSPVRAESILGSALRDLRQ